MTRKLLSVFCLLFFLSNTRAAVYYVDGGKADNTGAGTSWANAKKDVQEAINLVTTAGDEVWVKAGTYLPTLDANGNAAPTDARDKNFYITATNIKLYGGFDGTETLNTQRNATTNVTILSGDLDGSGGTTDAYHVLLIYGRTSACVVDGFTLSGGRGNGISSFTVTTPSTLISRTSGGGIYNGGSSSATVSNCIFSANTATTGGGMYNTGSSSPTVSNCTFRINTANQGGGMYNTTSTPSVSGCTFSTNTATSNGGGMYNNSSTATVSACIFSANTASTSGGGIFNFSSSAVISACIFSANTASSLGGGMYNSSGNPPVSSCVFSANSAINGGGIYNNSGSPAISSCVFSVNTASTSGGGLYISAGSPVISACTFNANTATTDGGGLYYVTASGGTLTNCIVYGSTGSTTNRKDIYKAGTSTTLTVSYSLIGDYISTGNNYTSGSGILSGDPLFVNSATPAGADGTWRTSDDGLRIYCASTARDAGTGTTPTTDILGNARVGAVDMGAYEVQTGDCPGVLYVDSSKADNTGAGTSWATAKKDVQAAINAVAVGGEVWVKAGTYLPTLDANGNAAPTDTRDKTFYLTVRNIKLYGGFDGTETLNTQRDPATNVTILSGDLDGSGGTSDAYHVLYTYARTVACVVDGFTLSGGRANGSGSFTVTNPSTTIFRNGGGGLYNNNGSLTASNCIFSANTTSSLGGGIYNGGGTPSVSSCTFNTNSASQGGGMYTASGTPTVSTCVFSANTATSNGGGMYNTTSTPTVSTCVFSANTATSNGGGMYNTSSNTTVSNCVFSANTSSSNGGGMYNNGSSPVISACTFNANTATTDGGGLYYVTASGGTLTNCIVYGSTGSSTNRQDIYKAGTSTTLTVSYSLIGDYISTGNNYTSGSGILSGDPLFVNSTTPTGADGVWRTSDDGLRIDCASPARNAGTGTTPTTDLLGNSRLGTIDMGAYENQGGSASSGLASATASNTSTQQSGGTTTYGDCGTTIATLLSSGASPVSGSVVAKVYIQSNAPTVGQMHYVRRYYDITPAANTNTATVTLYFTQADFDDYNAVRGSYPSLPVDAADAAGDEANIRITQEHGTSATGAPGSYSGWGGAGPGKIVITPALVAWNSDASFWEVTFPVTGFSGFFLHSGGSGSGPLPVKLLSFSARKVGKWKNRIEWETAQEEPDTRYTVARSGDGKIFVAIGEVKGNGTSGAYTLDDAAPLAGDNFYRLKIEESGTESYSNTVLVRSDATVAQAVVTIAPNPAIDVVTISCEDKTLWGKEAQIVGMDGRARGSIWLSGRVVLNMRDWPAGMYMLNLPNGGVLRLIKQ